MARWLYSIGFLGTAPRHCQVGSFRVCRIVCKFRHLDAAVAAPGQTVRPVRTPASRKLGFRRLLIGDDAVKPSGFRPVAQGAVGTGFTPVRAVEGLFMEGKEEAG